MRIRFSLAIALAGLACASPGESPPRARSATLIYGDDDRNEVGSPAVDDELFATARAVAAVIPRGRVRSDADGAAEITARSLLDTEQLCADEPYAAQPSAAACTAVLIDDNLLATASHCFAHLFDCQSYVFAFDYFYGTATAAPSDFGPLEVHECRRIVMRVQDRDDSSERRDYAIVELDRSVTGRTPLPLRNGPSDPGEPLIVISSTGGIPLKVDLGASVLDPRPTEHDFFILDSDTARGSSGAPVLDYDGRLLGLIARGRKDYLFDEAADCHRTVRVASPGVSDGGVVELGAGEHATYAEPAIQALCEAGYPSMRLCGIAPACGDGTCSPGEDSAQCESDCAAASAPVRELGPKPSPPRSGQADDRANGCAVTAGRSGPHLGLALLLVVLARRLAS